MKKLNSIRLLRYVFFMLIAIFMVSCEKVDGKGRPPGFFRKEFQLDGKQQTITLLAKNDVDWFLAYLIIQGENLYIENWDADSRIKYSISEEKSRNTSNNLLLSVYKIEFEDWFVWERLSNKKIIIQLSENKEGRLRKISFQASTGNAGDNITITQNSIN